MGSTFLHAPPLWRELGLPGVALVEPLRVQLGFGETPEDGEREVGRIQRRYVVDPTMLVTA
jgi:hypothetical protein